MPLYVVLPENRFDAAMNRNPQTAQAKIMRRWTFLTMAWALYYFLAFTLGGIPAFMSQTIWGGAALVGLVTVPVFMRRVRVRDIPREGVHLILFLLWTLVGWFYVTDMALFMRFLKLVGMLVLIVIAVSIILRNSGGVKWFYLAYLGVAVFRVLYGEGPVDMERIADTRVVDRITSANAVGYSCVLGVVSVLGLMQELKSFWFRAGLLAAGGIALYGVILSASRGALVALMSAAFLWPLLCLVGSSRFKAKAMTVSILILIVSYGVFQFIIQDTYMGVRFTHATQLEDGSSQMRLELFMTGMKAFAQNPIFGLGLGQFGTITRTGQYAHNEFAEIIATTGLPGMLLYYPIYWLAWRRLTQALRRLPDPVLRYRINMTRMILLILLISGSLSRPVFITQDSMFLLGIVIGMAHWAERISLVAGGYYPVPAWGWSMPGFPVPSKQAVRPAGYATMPPEIWLANPVK